MPRGRPEVQPGEVWSNKRTVFWNAGRSFDNIEVQARKGESRSYLEFTMPSSVQFHRVLRTSPETLYKAFIDPDAMVKWLPPNGFTGKVHEMNASVGGGYRMSFTNFSTGHSHSFGGRYTELKPGERICYINKFEDANLPEEMHVTISLKKVSVGTELNIVQAGIPDVIPPEACYLGWQESLTLLAKLVEAEIPD
jgi:uncharacterized protein YndB with AHSA1/START domain